MNMTKSKLFTVLSWLLLSAPLFAASLPTPVSQALKAAGIPESAIGIYVHEIGARKSLLAVNADTAMNPASVMKLVTTFAGLELLGPAYSWKTELYADGVLKGDTLRGNLVIKGYGDPKLNLENFWLLTRKLRQTGLREISGDLVLDGSAFNLSNGDPAAFDNKPYRAYNVAPEALLVNYRTLSLRLIPQPESKTVRVVADPLPESLELSNKLTLTSGRCSEWRDALAAEIRTDKTGSASVTLNGSYAADCGEKTYLLSLQDSSAYTYSLFRQLWAQHGGIIRGKARIGAAPEGMSPLETWQSPPLAEIIRDINKFSNNIAARQLFISLGAGMITPPAPATLAKSVSVIRQWLASKQLDFPELVLENGSGLSRTERISTRHLGELLLAAFHSPLMPEFVSSLPISAVDGTMKKRFNGSAVAGQAHIKTGLLEGVRTMAGYVLDQSGRRVVVVFFVNHPKSGSAQPAMDALLQWAYERPS